MKNEELLIALGRNITKFRKDRGMTTQALADECDIEKSNLIPIEKGKINTTVITLLKLANALKVDVKDFFDFD
jgi:transcriptional regulator with XRE-family HTH domain